MPSNLSKIFSVFQRSNSRNSTENETTMDPTLKRAKQPSKRSKSSKASCGCKAGCKEGHCGCRKNGNRCGDSCGCTSLKNCTNVFGQDSLKRERSIDEESLNNNIEDKENIDEVVPCTPPKKFW